MVSVTQAEKSIFSSSSNCRTKRFIILHVEGGQLRRPLLARVPSGQGRDLVSLGWHWDSGVSLSSLCRQSHRHLPFSRVGVRGRGLVNSDYSVGMILFPTVFGDFFDLVNLNKFKLVFMLQIQFQQYKRRAMRKSRAGAINDRTRHFSSILSSSS